MIKRIPPDLLEAKIFLKVFDNFLWTTPIINFWSEYYKLDSVAGRITSNAPGSETCFSPFSKNLSAAFQLKTT